MRHKTLLMLPVILAAAITLSGSAWPRRVNTRPATSQSRPKKGNARHHSAQTYTVTAHDRKQMREACAAIRFSGFDKPAYSRNESFFITNNSHDPLCRLELSVTYLLSDGRMLHERVIPVECDIPPGHTRNVTVPAWDRQGTFRYCRSKAPARGGAIPFDVSFTPVSFTFIKTPRR